MIIPSIDLMGGEAVQLVGGKDHELSAGDPRPLARKFRLSGEVAVIDLDAALGKGSNEAVILDLLKIAPCRVGGGIRSLERANFWLNAGAEKIILGTAAHPDLLKQLPKERVIAALDAVNGEVVVEGWTEKTGTNVLDQIEKLRDYVGGFLVTFVEREGRLGGTDEALAARVVEAAGDARVTIAGGVTTAEEIRTLDELGADAQVGMALYKGLLDFGDAIAAPLKSDRPDGLFPTMVCDPQGRALGLVYSSRESIREAVATGRGVYQSRKRGLWRKGERSGATQELLHVGLDCDRDALRFVVRQELPGFCHLERWSCFDGDGSLGFLSTLERVVGQRMHEAPEGSYTERLVREAGLLEAKLREEARELGEARRAEDVVWESADLLYFTLVALKRAGGSLEDVEQELYRRSKKISRRPGDAKE